MQEVVVAVYSLVMGYLLGALVYVISGHSGRKITPWVNQADRAPSCAYRRVVAVLYAVL